MTALCILIAAIHLSAMGQAERFSVTTAAAVVIGQPEAAPASQPPTPATPPADEPAQPAATEPAPAEASPPGDLTDPTLDDIVRDRRMRAENDQVFMPVAPGLDAAAAASIPGLAGDDIEIKPGRFFPEGTFLVRRPGSILVTRGGDVIFIPEVTSETKDARGRGERPMVMQPSQTLTRIRGATSHLGPQPRIVVSGQLFVYNDRQYILPTVFNVVSAESGNVIPAPAPLRGGTEPSESTESETQSAAAASAEEAASAADPEVGNLIKELNERRATGRAGGRTPRVARTDSSSPPRNAPAVAIDDPEAPPPEPGEVREPGSSRVDLRSLLPEGTLLVDRRARLVRVGRELAMAFDHDADTRSEGPLIILRCRALERLEKVVDERGEDLVLRVSGRVFTYRSANYLLPSLYQVEQRGDLDPLQ